MFDKLLRPSNFGISVSLNYRNKLIRRLGADE